MLPSVSKVLGKHKHILKLDNELLKVIEPDKIVASYREAKTLQDKLVHSKAVSHPKKDVAEVPGTKEVPEINNDSTHKGDSESVGGCHQCNQKCVKGIKGKVCKRYLIQGVNL